MLTEGRFLSLLLSFTHIHTLIHTHSNIFTLIHAHLQLTALEACPSSGASNLDMIVRENNGYFLVLFSPPLLIPSPPSPPPSLPLSLSLSLSLCRSSCSQYAVVREDAWPSGGKHRIGRTCEISHFLLFLSLSFSFFLFLSLSFSLLSLSPLSPLSLSHSFPILLTSFLSPFPSSPSSLSPSLYISFPPG